MAGVRTVIGHRCRLKGHAGRLQGVSGVVSQITLEQALLAGKRHPPDFLASGCLDNILIG